MSEPKWTPPEAMVVRVAWDVCYANHNRHDEIAEPEARKTANRSWPNYVPVAHAAIEATPLRECVEALGGIEGRAKNYLVGIRHGVLIDDETVWQAVLDALAIARGEGS